MSLAQDLFQNLLNIRKAHGHLPKTTLSDQRIIEFLSFDPNLQSAVRKASGIFSTVSALYPELLKHRETEAIKLLRSNLLNFYAEESASPFIPLASQGPWIVTFSGGVVYSSGGYGMLGFGHNADFILRILSKEQTMANIMTPNISQYRFTRSLIDSIGIGRQCPYSHFSVMNTGSDAVSVADRISDAYAKIQTEPGTKHHGKKIKFLALEGGFHGRTYRAAQASSSTARAYQALASFRNADKLVTVRPNDLDSLTAAYENATAENIYFELMLMEPVMGEGRAGYAISPEFYGLARQLTKDNQTLLMIDSIQAGLRCHGVLSICDYPGFEQIAAPDLETFSKAINGGQYPLSVLAMTAETAAHYKIGIYGNTMTGNPRGLDLGAAVLGQMTPAVRQNIVKKGLEFKSELSKLQQEFPTEILEVLGQGLLLSAQLKPKIAVEGIDGLEQRIRHLGVEVIHSSGNRLRFTPWFMIKTPEINLIIDVLREALKSYDSKE